jgi:hypothetical protein
MTADNWPRHFSSLPQHFPGLPRASSRAPRHVSGRKLSTEIWKNLSENRPRAAASCPLLSASGTPHVGDRKSDADDSPRTVASSPLARRETFSIGNRSRTIARWSRTIVHDTFATGRSAFPILPDEVLPRSVALPWAMARGEVSPSRSGLSDRRCILEECGGGSSTSPGCHSSFTARASASRARPTRPDPPPSARVRAPPTSRASRPGSGRGAVRRTSGGSSGRASPRGRA